MEIGPVSDMKDQDVTLAAYQVITARRTAYDSMMWQSPGLGLTAQAFLMTIALAPDTKIVARLLASLLGCVVALLSIQLMAKHRYLESIDSRLVEELETKMLVQTRLSMKPHSSVTERNAGRVVPSRLALLRSFDVWCLGMGTFALADVFVVLWTVAGATGIAS
jgi:hypothetical protein